MINQTNDEVNIIDNQAKQNSCSELTKDTTNTNCFALTVRKDYSLSIVKHVIFHAWRNSLRIALNVIILNILTFLF